MAGARGGGDVPVVGIDLGTTYSVVAVFDKKRAEVVQNDDGCRTTPSYVAFTDEGVLVGQAAKDIGNRNSLFDSKRLLGRCFDDDVVQEDIPHWPFRVLNDGGMPKYEVVKNGLPERISPKEVSARVLRAMKTIAQDFLERRHVKDVVVTVPAYFNDAQRQATIAAAKLAELEVLAILNEPTAAALAFGFGGKKNSTILIYDFGGGTLDVTIMQIRGDNFVSKAHGGDTHLGGQDFDNLLLKFVVQDIDDMLGIKLSAEEDADVLHELRRNCEGVKKQLSRANMAVVNVFLSRHNKGYRRNVTRAAFEDMSARLFKRAIDVVGVVLLEARMTKEQIDDIVLVGGSTRIPKMRALISAFFDNRKELNKSVNADEAVAVGAAIHAAALLGQVGAKQITMKEVSSLSLSLAVAQASGLVAVLIPRNSALPCRVTRAFTTASEQQDEAEIKICQGERAHWRDNVVLGTFTLAVPARPAGEVDIDTTFALDECGVLTVSAVERSTGEMATITVESERRLYERELRRMLNRAQKYQREDDEARERARSERFAI